MRNDLRCALRLLRKDPGFSAAAILLFAVGIAANTAVFSFVNTLFWKPLAAPAAQELARISIRHNNGQTAGEFSYSDYRVVRDHTASFAAMAAVYGYAPLNLTAEGETREELGAVVTANYFDILGVRPIRGRLFRPDEDEVPDRDPVALISARLWKRRFAGDPGVLGREIRINGVSFQVIGILPGNFYGDQAGVSDELWIPSMMLRTGYRWCDAISSATCSPLRMLGRLRHGRSLAAANAQLGTLSASLRLDPGDRLVAFTAAGADPEEKEMMAAPMRALLTIAAVLLLIACSNLAGLLLARGMKRSKEIALRVALGASRGRIVRQLLAENLALALLGGGLGLAVSLWLRDALTGFFALQSEGGQRVFDVSVDGRVLLFSAGLALASGLLAGLLPALRSASRDIAGELKLGSGSMGSGRSGRLRDALAAGQFALALALVVTAALLARSSQDVMRNSNFDPTHVAVLRVRPQLAHYTSAQADDLYRAIKEKLAALPGVQSATIGMGGRGLLWTKTSGESMNLTLPGGNQREVRVMAVSAGFAATLGIPLLQGRTFNQSDGEQTPRVVMVNRSAARAYWGGESPLGRFAVLNGLPYEVVGVLGDLPSARGNGGPQFFTNFWQSAPGAVGDARLAVRVSGDPAAMLAEIRRAVAEVDPQAPLGEDMPLVDQVRSSYATLWLARGVALACGALAVALSAIGLYSVLAYGVRIRRREIGVRMALGAQSAEVVRLVVRHGLAVALAGSAAGMLLGLAAARLLAAALYGVHAAPPSSFVIGIAVLLAAALAASFLPARTAAKVDPMVALRSE